MINTVTVIYYYKYNITIRISTNKKGLTEEKNSTEHRMYSTLFLGISNSFPKVFILIVSIHNVEN
jgi:hypothetical protein